MQQSPSIEFLVLGDWGRFGSDNQLLVSRAMQSLTLSRPIDFVLTVGDNFYEDGVIGLDDPHWWTSFEEPYYWDGLRLPWYATLGNHDYRGAPEIQVEYTAHSGRWNMPARYYRLSWPGPVSPLVDLFCLDTTPMVNKYRSGGSEEMRSVTWPDPYRQLCWLEEGLHCSNARWKIVVGHHAIASASPFHGPSQELVDRLLPLLVEYDVPLYLCGHEHDMQHLRIPGGVDCVVAGSGSEVRETGWNAHTVFAESMLGFVRVRATGDDVIVSFHDAAATVLHSASVVADQRRVDYRSTPSVRAFERMLNRSSVSLTTQTSVPSSKLHS